MVLESLLGPKKATKKPYELFFLGFLYASIGTFLGFWIFKNQASLVLVFLTVMAAIPLVFKMVKYEEKADTVGTKEWTILKHHSRTLRAYMFLFFGFVLAFTIWYLFLPDKLVQSTFNSQIETIRNINSNVIGHYLESSAFVDSAVVNKSSIFIQIFTNNMKVTLFSIFFAFFYGAGAIFILTWNASVIATAIGAFVRENISSLALNSGLLKIASYFGIFSLGILRYAIHGIPEILAYFVAGLAGGIISVAVIKHDFGSESFKKILADSVDLIIIAIGLVFFAAIIEVYVTPLFF